MARPPPLLRDPLVQRGGHGARRLLRYEAGPPEVAEDRGVADRGVEDRGPTNGHAERGARRGVPRDAVAGAALWGSAAAAGARRRAPAPRPPGRGLAALPAARPPVMLHGGAAVPQHLRTDAVWTCQRSPRREDRDTPEARSPGPGADPARYISESCVLTGERQARPGRGPVPGGTRAQDSDAP